MNYFQFLVLFLFCLPSCTKYKYVEIQKSSSKTLINDQANNSFQDSIKVSFSFEGENIPIEVKIDNKSGKTIYVDWQRSSVVVNGQRFSAFVNHAATYSKSVSVTREWWSNTLLTETRTSGLIAFPESRSEFPNNSYIIKYIGSVGDFGDFQNKPIPNDFITTNKGKVITYLEVFDESNSSLNLWINLKLSYSPEFTDVFNYEEFFYVSKLAEIKAKPSKVLEINNFQGYIKKVNFSPLIITSAIVLPFAVTILLLQ